MARGVESVPVVQRSLEDAIGSSPSLRSSLVIKIPRLEGQEELAAELEKVSYVVQDPALWSITLAYPVTPQHQLRISSTHGRI